MGKGASQATGLGSAKAPEPHSRLRPTDAIPCARFTPGPWERTVCRVEGDGQTICVADLMRRADYEDGAKEAEANARLIAAAPDLFQAVAGALEHMEWSTPQGSDAYNALDAALRKALGRP